MTIEKEPGSVVGQSLIRLIHERGYNVAQNVIRDIVASESAAVGVAVDEREITCLLKHVRDLINEHPSLFAPAALAAAILVDVAPNCERVTCSARRMIGALRTSDYEHTHIPSLTLGLLDVIAIMQILSTHEADFMLAITSASTVDARIECTHD